MKLISSCSLSFIILTIIHKLLILGNIEWLILSFCIGWLSGLLMDFIYIKK